MLGSYLRGQDRSQRQLLPECVDDYVGKESIVRVVDAFVDNLERGAGDGLPELRETGSRGGAPGYDPAAIARVLIWGYLRRTRSTRMLELAAKTNLEVIWLLGGLTPDHSSISRFRKSEADRIKGWLREFNLCCSKLGLFGSEVLAVDGAHLKAPASKSTHYTKKRLERWLEKIDARIDEYMENLAEEDAEDPAVPEGAVGPQEVTEAIEKLQDEQKRVRKLMVKAEDSPTGQTGLVDPEAVLMKKKPGRGSAVLGYSAQIAVDGENHLVAAADAVAATSDKGLLAQSVEEARGVLPETKTETETETETGGPAVLADAGYVDFEDVAAVEAAGCRPFVDTGKLSQGAENKGLFGRDEFRYEPEEDCYHCPGSKKLQRHSDCEIRGRSYQVYYNTKACRECALRSSCTKGRYRKLKRSPHQACIDRMRERMERTPETYGRRKSIVEHPFGTMLFWDGGRELLCRGLRMAKAELGLSALSYNVRRAAEVLGTAELARAIREMAAERATGAA